MTVAEIYETAKRLKMTMLGLAKRGGTKQVLAPPANMQIVVEADDKIVVIADLVT